MEAAREVLEASSGNAIAAKKYLIATIGKEALMLAKDLHSKSMDSVAYTEIKDILLKHLVRQRLEIAERSTLYNNLREKVSQYFTRG